ncbi:uncharacterized protein MYCGRDRAFT_90561 [Zymoseptoria tritici IPO323]|uniref:Uncharacterized protein n=1 Tax=Zymoseptoria tritici (strain CBS 115943 / IPO323) TaxID=336722 RepID=F9X2Q7_ZYMTI|nr:uncharacterized protein MYCGRDRAFT_90561 [Zymoseptoria tritici IPO323]EGP90651.1 hypothetical protein MYCGRDRAFT_90561 [Zymoseptoria tritici IPO323]
MYTKKILLVVASTVVTSQCLPIVKANISPSAMYPKRQQANYVPIANDEGDLQENHELPSIQDYRRCSPSYTTLYVFFVFTSCAMELVGSVKKTLVYDRRFSSAPSNETEKAWMGLFPDGLGFVQHPIVSPEISAIAVFHSLHCLHAIHGGYYKAVSMHLNKRQQGNHHDASDGVSASHEDHQDPAHLRHCFDYLRQSLMCRSWTELYMDERT